MKKILTLEDQKALANMASKNWGAWEMPVIGIMYRAVQIEDGFQTATIVAFDYPVTTTEGYTGTKMRVYPISKRKPNGGISVLRN